MVPAGTAPRRGRRIGAAALAGVLLVSQVGATGAHASDLQYAQSGYGQGGQPGYGQGGYGQGAPGQNQSNAMGYRLLTEQEARSMPRAGGMLGMDLGRGQRVNDHGMAFDIMEITQIKRGSPAEAAGLHRGDQIIAVNGQLFASLNTFAAYVGSMRPGSIATVDYMPRGAGPEQAQRVAVTVGGAGQPVSRRDMPPPHEQRAQEQRAQEQRAQEQRPQEQRPQEEASGGMSTGTKLAIGAAAIGLFGCYKFGCFSRGGKRQNGAPATAQTR